MGDENITINIEQLERDTRGRYKFERILGHGAYGVVYAALDIQTGRHVAVKRVERVFDSLLDAKRILREVKILGILHHENVTTLFDVCATADFVHYDTIIVVVELMDTDLHHIIYSDQKLSVDHRRYFVYQILRGLKYVHSTTIIHRDLKPSNLLVNANCDLKLCDFGLARIENDKEFMTEYVTTRWYRAPEVLLLFGHYGPEIDLWSVGCIFAELILRKPLFPGKSTLNQLSVIVERIGSPTEEDLADLKNLKARKFMMSLPHREMVDWTKLLRGGTPQEIDLISRMLTWDPKKRITADEAVEHPYFAKLHDPFDEPVSFPVDEFDFERNDVTMEQMRREIWSEILHYHPDSQ
ncbi:Mitogen-activated protein kinase MMK1 [Tritrichomonas foetus]|uniref:Mitogen-activated protein kinase n=1 Tax=Tritrichomonas foetus TaxID=1144522 RepID=A0A1J4KTY4_9EUKA|nr:Mitogen-activated protein kinase MMK1 [Tritrichomonas foetus]|eukprot:OHT14602.1 Mitogen-activated protein kinase MMK1 [Tritrichomonas foetus]